MSGKLASQYPPTSDPTSQPNAAVGGGNGHAADAAQAAPPVQRPTHDNLLHLPTPTESVIAHAMKSLHTFDHNPLAREANRSAPPLTAPIYDSPYARSNTSTAPGSPRIPPLRQNSGTQTPRVRPHATTLNIPGMTRSKVSPDGRIPNRDVASKLVIIMVGLPARGKSYITRKLQRYLAWQQHNTMIFNVGERRRLAAGPSKQSTSSSTDENVDMPLKAASILLNGVQAPVIGEPPALDLNTPGKENNAQKGETSDEMDQNAKFFDPKNESASELRKRVALETLEELLDYLLVQGGSVGILDATNSTLQRRKLLVQQIKKREPQLGILFIESICDDQSLLEANMRLKLSGPDYKDKDPVKSLEDFRARVKAYESAYEPLGKWEEDERIQYIQMIDVGKKIVQYSLTGFLSGGIASYLTTFNLAPRQIWITRHGQSEDNVANKIGGNSPLTERGHIYGQVLHSFITRKRQEWIVEQKDKFAQASFPPQPGDHTPPYPEPNTQDPEDKNFCVWTSGLRRSVETAEYFDADDDYDVKSFEMLNELNSGKFEGLTYDEIALNYPEEYTKRSQDKLHYMYPGVGGEGYLQVINRLREMVREIERITDHVLLISHRSVCRVLMAYFMDLTRDDIADLDVPLGMLFSIEPKPYGYEFHAYRYNERLGWFDEVPNYKPRRTVDRNN